MKKHVNANAMNTKCVIGLQSAAAVNDKRMLAAGYRLRYRLISFPFSFCYLFIGRGRSISVRGNIKDQRRIIFGFCFTLSSPPPLSLAGLGNLSQRCVFGRRFPERGILIVGAPESTRHIRYIVIGWHGNPSANGATLDCIYFCNNSALSGLGVALLHQMLNLKFARLRNV